MSGKAQVPENAPTVDAPRPPPAPSLLWLSAAPQREARPWVKDQSILGEYVVLDDKLGEGGMGVVYKIARKHALDQCYAVKRVRVGVDAQTPEERASLKRRFLAELQAWLDLPPHPHLVRLSFFRTIDDELAFFSEYVDGGTLLDWIERPQRRSIAGTLDLAIQFAWGLHAVHQWDLLHCDVKPENVLLTRDGIAKVSDYGLIESLAAGKGAIAAGRSPLYCSPEQEQNGTLTLKADMWSWGVSVLQMFTGRTWWNNGAEAAEALESYLSGQRQGVPGLPAMPKQMGEVLRRCFQTAPSERWGTMIEITQALRDVHMETTRTDHDRPVPQFPRAAERSIVAHDRWTKVGVQWVDAREALAAVLRVAGRDPAEADRLIPARTGSREAQAINDLAAYEQAQHIVKGLVETGGQGLERALAVLLKQTALIKGHLDDTPGALAAYDRVIGIYTRLVAAGRSELENDLAAASMSKAIALQASGQLPHALGDFDRAIGIYARLVAAGRSELENDLAGAYMNKASALRVSGQLAQALAEYDRAIGIFARLVAAGRSELESALAAAYMSKAVALQASGQLPHALGEFDRAIGIYAQLVVSERSELENDLAAAYVGKANALQVSGQLPQALAEYDRAIGIYERLAAAGRSELEDALARAYMNKAVALQDSDLLRRALADYDRAIGIYERMVTAGRSELKKYLAMAYWNKGIALESSSEFPPALEAYEKVLEIDPGDARAWSEKGDVLAVLGRSQDAADAYRSALRLDANLPMAWERLAGILLQAGHAEEAVTCFERVFAIGKADTETAMGLAQAYRFEKRLDDAIALYDKVIAADSSNCGAIRMRAACRMQKGADLQDRASAAPLIAQVREDYRRANELEPDNEQGKLDPVEVDVCWGDSQIAVKSARAVWPQLKAPHNRVICAWLGAIAALLARRPESEWAEYRTGLDARETTLRPDAWSVAEIEGLIARLRADLAFDRATLAKIEEIHRLFLAHFAEAGPAIR